MNACLPTYLPTCMQTEVPPAPALPVLAAAPLLPAAGPGVLAAFPTGKTMVKREGLNLSNENGMLTIRNGD